MLIETEIFIESKKGLKLTEEIEKLLQKEKITNGLMWVRVNSPTAILTLTNTFDNRTYDDIVDVMDKNCPTLVQYETKISPFDSSGRIKSSMVGNHLTLWIENGKCMLGSSQAIVAIEFDGPKKVKLEIEIIASNHFEKDVIKVDTQQHGLHDVTDEIKHAIEQNKVDSGFAYLFVPHSTSGIWLAEDSEGFIDLTKSLLDRMVPEIANFKHRETPSDAAGHIKTSLAGTYLLFKIDERKCLIGENKRIYFMEFDGPRPRKIQMVILTK